MGRGSQSLLTGVALGLIAGYTTRVLDSTSCLHSTFACTRISSFASQFGLQRKFLPQYLQASKFQSLSYGAHAFKLCQEYVTAWPTPDLQLLTLYQLHSFSTYFYVTTIKLNLSDSSHKQHNSQQNHSTCLS